MWGDDTYFSRSDETPEPRKGVMGDLPAAKGDANALSGALSIRSSALSAGVAVPALKPLATYNPSEQKHKEAVESQLDDIDMVTNRVLAFVDAKL